MQKPTNCVSGGERGEEGVAVYCMQLLQSSIYWLISTTVWSLQVSHTACKDEFRRNPRSHSFYFVFQVFIEYLVEMLHWPSQPVPSGMYTSIRLLWRCYLLSYDIGVKDRSMTQPKVILVTLPPPSERRDLWGVRTVYVCTLTYPLRFICRRRQTWRCYLLSYDIGVKTDRLLPSPE